MAEHHVTRVLPYTPDQLFTLVGDVDAYPQFVPWITTMRVGAVRATGEGVTTLDAEAGVGFSFLKERFSTRVTRDAGARAIKVDLLSGPFRKLDNRWLFRPHPDGCEVVFDIAFQFKARMLDVLLKANFGYAVDKLIACFEDRARQLYGSPVERV
ncbi:MAG: type II toxin-antitoxin system RatA family toxin [Caulobacteraceae bacterium]